MLLRPCAVIGNGDRKTAIMKMMAENDVKKADDIILDQMRKVSKGCASIAAAAAGCSLFKQHSSKPTQPYSTGEPQAQSNTGMPDRRHAHSDWDHRATNAARLYCIEAAEAHSVYAVCNSNHAHP